MNERRKALDLFFDQLWQVGLWTLTIVLMLIWVGVILRLPAPTITERPPAAQTN